MYTHFAKIAGLVKPFPVNRCLYVPTLLRVAMEATGFGFSGVHTILCPFSKDASMWLEHLPNLCM